MEKFLGLVFLAIAGMTIYNGESFFFPGIPMQTEGFYRYFYATPNILIGLFLLFKNKEREPSIYKCLDCQKVFDEFDIEYDMCPKCKGELLDVETYYKNVDNQEKDISKNVKNEDEVTEMIRKRWDI